MATSWITQGMVVEASQWDHIVDFDPNYRLLWTSNAQDITFEIQARTLGWVGVGFSHDGTLADSDVAIGWIDQGHVYFQTTRHNFPNLLSTPPYNAQPTGSAR
ncbi:hypothetical protein pipiens_012035 [Culex pipiens pipiens]|uniref:DOMON domain-containing protein n=1 Tax=Culex pipiens pipiens TaxID=38569 RepID=A0ABD1D4K8_CULPP